MVKSLLAGLIVALASVVGSIIGLIFKKISHKTNDTFLGFAGGVMLAAGFMGLLPDAFVGENWWQIALGVVGVLVGAVFISLIDKFVPHMHFDNEHMKESETKSGKNRAMLLVIAIAIHNIPEGLATGIVFSGGNANALMVVISMIVQKIPEGLIVVIPLLAMGMKKSKVFGISLVVAGMMLPGVVIGALLGALPQALTSFFYAFTFGAIVYVVSDEIIPESHEHGFERSSTFALLIGIIVVMLLSLIG